MHICRIAQAGNKADIKRQIKGTDSNNNEGLLFPGGTREKPFIY